MNFNDVIFSSQHYLLPAHHLDGVNLQGFYVWKLQDRHVPQFGLFTSTHHQSKAKASVSVYREIITHGGFPEDNTKQTCRFNQLQESCTVCAWIFKNKALLVFGGCLLTTAVTLAALVIVVIFTKKTRTGDRGRRMSRMSSRRRRERAPMCSCPPVKCST